MKVAFDTSCLLLLLDSNASAPIDPQTGDPLVRANDRINYLVATITQAESKAIVPTPVLAEVLAKAGDAGLGYQKTIHNSAAMEIVNFDQRAAIELASLERDNWGPLRGSTENPRQKVKVDRLILANCKVHKVDTIYCDDQNMRSLAEQVGISVVHSWELPLPPEPPQGELKFGDD